MTLRKYLILKNGTSNCVNNAHKFVHACTGMLEHWDVSSNPSRGMNLGLRQSFSTLSCVDSGLAIGRLPPKTSNKICQRLLVTKIKSES
jgi:hypothetical protein